MFRVLFGLLVFALVLAVQPLEVQATTYTTPVGLGHLSGAHETGLVAGSSIVNDQDGHHAAAVVSFTYIEATDSMFFEPLGYFDYDLANLSVTVADAATVPFVLDPLFPGSGDMKASFDWLRTGIDGSFFNMTVKYSSPLTGSNSVLVAYQGGHNDPVPEIPAGAAVPMALLLGAGVYYLRRRQAVVK